MSDDIVPTKSTKVKKQNNKNLKDSFNTYYKGILYVALILSSYILIGQAIIVMLKDSITKPHYYLLATVVSIVAITTLHFTGKVVKAVGEKL